MTNTASFDAIVVGSGPNGLAAAITLRQAGVSVLLIEGKNTIGGGLRTEELTLPGFSHDVCSAVHPLAIASPFFSTLPLNKFGLEYIQPTIAAAHPFDDGTAAIATNSVETTSHLLGEDEKQYSKLLKPVIEAWPGLDGDLLGPLSYPSRPLSFARFGLNAMLPASSLVKRFKTSHARGLWAGMAAHSIQPLGNLASSAIAMVLLTAAHMKGWPIPKGGSQSIANALAGYFKSIGGIIETGTFVRSIKELPKAKAYFFDVTPAQLLKIAGDQFSSIYTHQLKRYRYGMGVFKIDWALDQPIPFAAKEARQAGTIHIGGTFEEIEKSELESAKGVHSERPFALLSQPTVFDPSRAPANKHTAWAYCHVPNGSSKDMTNAIEQQVERFAPGFTRSIIARHSFNTIQLEEYNPNYVGGDINGGIIDIRQLFTRPALRLSPYRTSANGIYICSSSTPPGGGVHGMCGFHAARRGLKDIFGIAIAKR
jgi:phytoene dehydrogenase-like protein